MDSLFVIFWFGMYSAFTNDNSKDMEKVGFEYRLSQGMKPATVESLWW